MSGKTILEVASPVAQTVEAIVELLSHLGRTVEPLREVMDLGAAKLMHGSDVPELADSVRPIEKWPGSYSGLVENAPQKVA